MQQRLRSPFFTGLRRHRAVVVAGAAAVAAAIIAEPWLAEATAAAAAL